MARPQDKLPWLGRIDREVLLVILAQQLNNIDAKVPDKKFLLEQALESAFASSHVGYWFVSRPTLTEPEFKREFFQEAVFWLMREYLEQSAPGKARYVNNAPRLTPVELKLYIDVFRDKVSALLVAPPLGLTVHDVRPRAEAAIRRLIVK